MNYIVHLFLSDYDEGLIVGNFIGDQIKGKSYSNYKPEIQKGILLHRHIDSFTDSHPLIHKSKSVLVPNYNHWSGILIDVFFGHFLTLEWKKFSQESLKVFSERIHEVLLKYYLIIPPDCQYFLDYTIQFDRIANFDQIKTVDEVLKGMAGRTNHVSNIENAVEDLLYNYDLLKNNFNTFMPELISSAKNYILSHD